MNEPSKGPALVVADVTKTYGLGDSRVEVLNNIDLELDCREMCAVMGPSGVGKSTLLHCVAGLVSPDSGKVEVFGKDVASLGEPQRTIHRRRQIGVIFQFFNLVPNLTATENVALPFLIDGKAADQAVIDGMLDRVGMKGRASHLPSQLSGGEMQLISIARALVHSPAVVLADEPTGNVNVATGRRIMALLREVVRDVGSALLLVTHNPEDAALADRVVFMKDGTLVEGAALEGKELSSATVHDRLKELGI